MKVLFPFVGDNVGGSHIAAVRLIKAFSDSAVEPLVVLHEAGALADYLDAAETPYLRLPDPRYVFAYQPRHVYRQFLNIAPRLGWFLHKQRVNIVHTNDQRMFWTWLVPTLLARRKFLLHLRYLLTSEHPTHLKLLPRAHAIVCDSSMVRATLPTAVQERSRIIHSALDWERPLPDRQAAKAHLTTRLGCPAGTRVIGYFANFIERKRPLLFVEVAARLAQACAEPLVFVMYGDDRQNFTAAIRQAASEYNLADSLHVMGFASPPEDYMAGCDLLMAPAVQEPLGLTLLEACLVGTPVIAADDAGHREIYGAVVPEFLAIADDSEDFARRAGWLLNDPQTAHKLVTKARVVLSDRFGIRSYARAIAEVYRELHG